MSSSSVDGESFQEIESQITELVRRAGQLALEHCRLPLQVEFKQENRSDPVTQADKAVEEFLKSAILERFPGHAIIGEEGTEIDVCLLYTSDAADDLLCVDLGGRRI